MKQSIAVLCIWLILAPYSLLASTHDPWDGTLWDVASPDIDQSIGDSYKEIFDLRKGVAVRMNKEHETLATASAGGVHKQGSARAFFQDAAPGTQVDGSAFDSGDLGSLWFDSNSAIDNQANVLTATTPTWTPLSTEIIAVAVAAAHTWADTQTFGVSATFTGGLTSNGNITLGAGDDLIGSATSDITINTNKFTVAGASGNTLVAGTFDSTGAGVFAATLDVVGNFDPTAFETTRGGFIDEDSMATDSAVKVSSQQSIKAYVDAQIAANLGLQASGAVVFNTTLAAANTFQDLDLSGTVGSNIALVILDVFTTGSGHYAVKQNGATGAFTARIISLGSGFGSGMLDFENSTYGTVITMTDASGIIEHGYVNNTDTINMTLLGYIL